MLEAQTVLWTIKLALLDAEGDFVSVGYPTPKVVAHQVWKCSLTAPRNGVSSIERKLAIPAEGFVSIQFDQHTSGIAAIEFCEPKKNRVAGFGMRVDPLKLFLRLFGRVPPEPMTF